MGDRERLGDSVKLYYYDIMDHAVPITVLWIDFALNRIYFEFNHFYATMFTFVLYGMINMTVTFVTGTPVYPPMSFDSVSSWLTFFVMLPLAAAFYTGLYYLSKYKFRKMGMHDAIEFEAVGETEVLVSSRVEDMIS